MLLAENGNLLEIPLVYAWNYTGLEAPDMSFAFLNREGSISYPIVFVM